MYKCNSDGTITALQAYSDADVSMGFIEWGQGGEGGRGSLALPPSPNKDSFSSPIIFFHFLGNLQMTYRHRKSIKMSVRIEMSILK